MLKLAKALEKVSNEARGTPIHRIGGSELAPSYSSAIRRADCRLALERKLEKQFQWQDTGAISGRIRRHH